MLKRLLTALTVVALLASPAAADIFTNFTEYDLGTITLDSAPNGGMPVEIPIFAEPNPKGVVGWGIEFNYAEEPENFSWASDVLLGISSPAGPVLTVGGLSTEADVDWDFQGSQSDAPGFYSDDPITGNFDDIGNNFFKDDPQPKGQWLITLSNDWNSGAAATQILTDVKFRLYKVPEPGSLGLLAVAGMGLTLLRRRTR